jgi:hypothetical protein
VYSTPVASGLPSTLEWAPKPFGPTPLAIYLDRTISGDGTDTLAGVSVYFATTYVTLLGQDVRYPDPDNLDRLLRFGWYAFGDNPSVGDGSVDYWRAPIWIDFSSQLWTPIPSTDGSNILTLFTSRVRWHLNDGAEAHLYVAGL